MSIGERLARARQGARLSITQVSQQTRIRETVIRGIEHDDFSPCGGDFYARGHIRSVARVVGVDAAPLIQEYDAAHGGTGPVSAAEGSRPPSSLRLRERRRPNWSAAMMVALAVVVSYAIIHALASPPHHANTTARRKPVPGAVPAPSAHRATATTTPGRNQPVLVQLAATEGCWVGVYGPDRALRWQAYIPAGAARSWVFTHRMSMKIGNPRGIVLTVNGHKMTSLGSQPITLNLQPGQTVRS
jgi:Helix-turn-helix domain/RodZ C-terminal domain